MVWVTYASLSGCATCKAGVGRVLDQMDTAGFTLVLAHGALDLGVAAVADEDAVAALAGVGGDLDVHLGDQRAGGVEHPQPALFGGLAHCAGHAVGAEDERCAGGHLVHFLDEHRAAPAQVLDHMLVVDHLVAHMDGCPETGQRPFHDLDGAIDPGAEAARVGQPQLHDPASAATARIATAKISVRPASG